MEREREEDEPVSDEANIGYRLDERGGDGKGSSDCLLETREM